MIFKTVDNEWRFGGGDLEVSAMTERLDGDGKPRLLDGKKVYKTGLQTFREQGGFEKHINVYSLKEPIKVFDYGTVYVPRGFVWVTPYMSGSGGFTQQGYSAICEEIVPESSVKSLPAPANN